MTLALTGAEERQLAELSRTMLSPLEHESLRSWCEAIVAGTKIMVAADLGGIAVRLEAELVIHADMATAGREYVERSRPLHDRLRFLDRAVSLGAWSRRLLFEGRVDEYLASPYYNEYIVPNRMFDALGLALARRKEPIAPDRITQLILHRSRRGKPFDERQLRLIRLLLPAFEAGLHALQTYARHRETLANALDQLREPLMICDSRGRPVHLNRALESLLGEDPESGRITEAMARVGMSIAAHCRRSEGVGPAQPPTINIRTQHGLYRLHGTFSERGDLLDDPTLLIAVETLSPRWPSEQELMRRFALTRSQARITLLLAHGKTNEEIACELSISPATARNHTARVREKLGIASRARVAALILADPGA